MRVIDNDDAMRAKTSSQIPYVRLATEEANPYFENWFGERDPEIVQAIKDYPTVRSCLIRAERDSEAPDLRLIDWETIRTRPDLNVCLNRIFKSLETFNSVKSWLDFHHLKFIYKDRYQLEDLTKIDKKNGTFVYRAHLRWYDTLPFDDRHPVPGYAVDSFVVEVFFDGSNGSFLRASCRWQTTM